MKIILCTNPIKSGIFQLNYVLFLSNTAIITFYQLLFWLQRTDDCSRNNQLRKILANIVLRWSLIVLLSAKNHLLFYGIEKRCHYVTLPW